MLTDLFAQGSFNGYLGTLDTKLDDRVQQCTSIAQLDELAPTITNGLTVEECHLRRTEAGFVVTEEEDLIRVRVNIPLDGNSQLLGMDPDLDNSPSARVDLYHPSERFMDDTLTPRVTLSRTFPAETEPAEVQRWAKAFVDSIEATLNFMHARIEEHRLQLGTRAAVLVEKRRQMLQTGRAIRDALGTGI